MAPTTKELPNEISSARGNDSDASYDMPEGTASLASASNTNSKAKALQSEKVENLCVENAVTGLAGEMPNNHDQKNSTLPSWIPKIPRMQQSLTSNVAQKRALMEELWLQSAQQTTGDSDVESVISNDSGLGNPETQSDEQFTDLKLDADLQSVRTDIQTEAEALLRTLDDISLNDETAVSRETSVQLRKHSRAIAYIFGDDVIILKRIIKDQDEELGKLTRMHATECARTNTATNETIFKVQQEKTEEIKILKRRHNSEVQKLYNQYENSKKRHKEQIVLLEQKAGLLGIDSPSYKALAEEHEKLKRQLAAAKAQISVLEGKVQQCQDSQARTEDEQAYAINYISELRNEKAVKDAKPVDCVQEARDYEEERDAALFEISELRTVVGNRKKEIEDAKRRDDEISRALEHEEKSKHKFAQLAGVQRSEIERLRRGNDVLLKKNQAVKLTGHTLSQQNGRLEHENTILKQQIQAFQDRRAVEATKLANIREKFEAALDQMRKDRASLREQSTGHETATPIYTHSTLRPYKTSADVAENKLPASGQKGSSGVQNQKDNPESPTAQRRERAIAESNAKWSFEKNTLETTSTCTALERENAILKDTVSQVSAQLQHARIGAKCTRDALAERNQELEVLNVANEKDNWVLRDALVTALTKVETLGKRLKTQSQSSVLAIPSETPAQQGSQVYSEEEALRTCGECLTAKLELSTVRNHMSIYQNEKEELKKAHLKALAEKENAQKELKQVNLNMTHFEKDASRARLHTENIIKNAIKVNAELERKLHVAQLELGGTKSRLSASQSGAESLAKEIADYKKELKVALGGLYKDDMALGQLTRWHHRVFAQKEANLKQRTAIAEGVADDERARLWNLRAEVQKDATELIKRTGGLGSSSHEILGKWADGTLEEI
ncbi:uncharacterized protein K444DRAFT_177044 [Hyaloscypha bicolor E]|uniref:Uncharacterized protein n=1 Tax=Hyaloscypha bicolor E TaxID=1095630 RepID=A0A2J6TQK3_9HELO|nr:uncharacterized protein K444DRAFT_177044 [Hyaloscypha bicolor E]PMD65303.1 hypothetical protein K444DRAFT_177044 [Hyaloscypha bicolor E]